MRIAYLIAAHHEPNLCRRLIRALAAKSTQVFVHVDARAAIGDFQLDLQGVTFLTDRLCVNRGGWSLTLAMMQLLQAAYRNSDCDYFIFLAGTDYPIKSHDQIDTFLSRRYPLSFINYYPLLEGSYGVTNLTRYYFVDEVSWLTRHRAAPPPRLVDWFAGHLPRRRFPAGSAPFRGSDRWCLQRDVVRTIIDCWESARGRAYRRYFKRTWGSDEMLFQTIVFNSSAAASCHLYDGEAVRSMIDGQRPPLPDEVRAHLHYIDWDVNREDPAILDERDFDRLAGSEYFFACKFLEARSARLLDLVDENLRRS